MKPAKADVLCRCACASLQAQMVIEEVQPGDVQQDIYCFGDSCAPIVLSLAAC